MATRKIKLTMSGDVMGGINAIVDIDFNGVNLDGDLEITGIKGSTTHVREYTVDVDAGSYTLGVEYKNDANSDTEDRNFYIEAIEIAYDGTNYKNYAVHEGNSNLTEWTHYHPHGYVVRTNPSYDADATRVFPTNYHRTPNPSRDDSVAYTDAGWMTPTGFNQTYGHDGEPGSNSKFLYDWNQEPVMLMDNKAATFTIVMP